MGYWGPPQVPLVFRHSIEFNQDPGSIPMWCLGKMLHSYPCDREPWPIHQCSADVIDGVQPLLLGTPFICHSQCSDLMTLRLLHLLGNIDLEAAAAKLLQSCPTLCNPIDGSPPGSSVHGILHARTLEWVAISFSRPGVAGRKETPPNPQ